MTHTSTEQERAEFEAWKEDYALTFEPNYNEHLEADCKAAFLAGMQAARRAPVGWQFYQDGKWWNGDDQIKDHRKNTEEAGFRVRDVYATPQLELLTVDALLAAAHGMVQDAVRYQALVESGNFAPSPFDNGMWGLRVSRVPSTKAELDAAVDRGIAAQAKQGEQ